MNTYQFSNGRTALFNPIEAPLYEPFFEMAFEIVLPINEEGFQVGRGETIWACGDRFTQAARRNNVSDSICFVRVLNDSFQFPQLKYGEIVPIVLRGHQQPVALLDEIEKFV